MAQATALPLIDTGTPGNAAHGLGSVLGAQAWMRLPESVTSPEIAAPCTRPVNWCFTGMPFTSAVKPKLIASPASFALCTATVRPPTVALPAIPCRSPVGEWQLAHC